MIILLNNIFFSKLDNQECGEQYNNFVECEGCGGPNEFVGNIFLNNLLPKF